MENVPSAINNKFLQFHCPCLFWEQEEKSSGNLYFFDAAFLWRWLVVEVNLMDVNMQNMA